MGGRGRLVFVEEKDMDRSSSSSVEDMLAVDLIVMQPICDVPCRELATIGNGSKALVKLYSMNIAAGCCCRDTCGLFCLLGVDINFQAGYRQPRATLGPAEVVSRLWKRYGGGGRWTADACVMLLFLLYFALLCSALFCCCSGVVCDAVC